MFKTMYRTIFAATLLTIGFSVSTVVNAQAAASDCTADAGQCDDVCSTERTWKIFKGKRFHECAARCEKQWSNQCKGKADDHDAAMDGEHRDGKEHPQDKEYGHEKNAEKVKGQHGKDMSAQHRHDGEHRKDHQEGENEMNHEHDEDKHKAKNHKNDDEHENDHDGERDHEDDDEEEEEELEEKANKSNKSKKGKGKSGKN